jgi:hypothetical protein
MSKINSLEAIILKVSQLSVKVYGNNFGIGSILCTIDTERGYILWQ